MKTHIAFVPLFCAWLLCATSTLAQPVSGEPMMQMPDMGKTGVVEGTVFTVDGLGQKKPVVGQEIKMIIFNNGQQVLMLSKTADEKGQFSFKKIFQNPEFEYGFGTFYEENLYVLPRFSLADGEDVKKIAFQIGAGSPYFRDMASMGIPSDASEVLPSMPQPNGGTEMPSSGEKQNHDTSWSKPYQSLAVVLGVLVAIAAAYFAGKKSA